MAELNVEQARFNMVEQQVRTWEVLDQRVLDVMAEVPREQFAPERYRHLAFADVELPLGHGQVMLAPKLVGRLLQALEPRESDSVLEIGTGTGYVTACLARLAGRVVSVEIFPELSRQAQEILGAMDMDNVTLRVGDAAEGWTQDGSFDAVAVTGSLPVLPEAFKHHLNVGGRLFAVVGELPVMEALLVTRVGENDWTTESLFDTAVPPLENARRHQPFIF